MFEIAYVFREMDSIGGIVPPHVLESKPVVYRDNKNIHLLYENFNKYSWELTKDHFRILSFPLEQVKRIVQYNVQNKSWITIYEDNECAGRYIVDTEAVIKETSKDATNDKADETIEQSGTVQEEA